MSSFDDLARELRDAVGGELRAESEEGERLAALSDARSSGLEEVVRDLAGRGSRIQVDAGGRSFHGTIVGHGADHAVVALEGARLHVRLSGLTALTVLGPGDSLMEPYAAGSFRAALFELEGRDGIELELADGRTLLGRVAVVASDHVVVDDGQQRILPLAALVGAVVRIGSR